jgi:hypothetical protein
MVLRDQVAQRTAHEKLKLIPFLPTQHPHPPKSLDAANESDNKHFSNGPRGTVCPTNGYAGYNRLIVPDRIGPNIQLAHCWAHARRKLIEITRTGPAPVAEEGVSLIRDLYAIEANIRGSDPAARLAIRQERSAPILARIDDWMHHHRARASAKSPLGEALAYITRYRNGLGPYLDHGILELDNNAAERGMRPIAKRGSLCGPSSSICKHWKCVHIDDATRVPFSVYGSFDPLRGQVLGTDLIRRAGYDLLSLQYAGFDKVPYPVICHA